MKFDLRRPCKECPFRNDRPGYLTRERARQIAHALDPGRPDLGGSFTCHKTTVPADDEDEDGDMMDGPNAQHCAGALIMLEKSGRTDHNQILRIMGRLGAYDPDKLDLDAPIHESAEAFIKAQPR